MTKPSEGVSYLESVPASWLDWVLSMFMRGIPSTEIISRCCQKGLREERAKALIAALKSNPLFDTILRHLEAKAKADSLLLLLAELESKRDSQGVRRYTRLSKERFFEDFVLANRPVVLTDILHPLFENRRWSPEALASEFGSYPVQVSVGERWIDQAPYRSTFAQIDMSLAEFIRNISTDRDSDLLYLTSEDQLLSRADFSPLFRSALFDCDYLDHRLATPGTVKLWIGPKGTRTPMHHDRVNVLLAQVHGRKRFVLCPAAQLPRMKNDYGCYSALKFDEKGSVSTDGIHRFVVEVGAGEALFIPAGWWHDVLALDSSVTLTYDNLVDANDAYSWRGVYWIRNCPGLFSD